MFLKSVRQVARSTSISPTPSCIASRASAPPITASRRHHRRHSSSKASSAPGGSRGPEQAAANTTDAPAQGERRPAGRLTRRKTKETAADLAPKGTDDAFINVPSVPPTNYLSDLDVALSSFFSLHRPISVTTPIPTPTTISEFNSIFDPPKPPKPTDVIFTLSNAVSALENGGTQQTAGSSKNKANKDLRWEIMQQTSSNGDLGSRSNGGLSIEQMQKLVLMFRPFNVPPTPRPIPDQATVNKDDETQSSATGPARRRLPKYVYLRERDPDTYAKFWNLEKRRQAIGASSVVTKEESRLMRESMLQHDQFPERLIIASYEARTISLEKAYEARQLALQKEAQEAEEPIRPSMRVVQIEHRPAKAPRRRTNGSGAKMTVLKEDASTDLPLRMKPTMQATQVVSLDHLAEGTNPTSGARKLSPRAMLLISVKRQRKLKMKKHKYKKLMKRTRTLRKREGRL